MILRDENIRTPKWMVFPRRATFLQMKWHLRELMPFLKDYLDDEIRFWILNHDQNDVDFIESYNRS